MRQEISKQLITQSSKVDKEKTYWLNKLSGELVKSHFPYDFKKPGTPRQEMDKLAFQLPDELVIKLSRISNQSNYNLYTILMAGLTLLLNKYTYSSHTDITIGAPIYRQSVEGNFINTVLAIRNQFSSKDTFKELIITVKKNLAEANENMNFPIERLPYYQDIPAAEEGLSLFETVILLENIHERKYIEHLSPGILFSFRKKEVRNIEGVVEYNAGLYKKESIRRIYSQLINILLEIDRHIDRTIGDINILSEEEQQQLLFEFNHTTEAYPRDKTATQLFEEQVEKTPDAAALVSTRDDAGASRPDRPVHEQQQITYMELNKKANQLALLLSSKGIEPGVIAGIMMEPSLEMIIGILGILKAGGAYLPIDPDVPEERINYMLFDSGAKILLTNSSEELRLNCQLSIVNCQLSMNAPNIPLHHSSFINHHSGNLAYIIYTSGTTGNPKGVVLTHQNLVNYSGWLSKALELTADDRTVLTSSFAFDLGYTAIYGALLHGGQLHLIPREHYIYGETLFNYIKENQITFLKVTPSLFAVMVYSPNFTKETCAALRLVILGGESINTADVKEAHTRCPHIRFMNHYGPTEATIGCVAQFIDFNQLDTYRETPTIGKPIHNTRVFILDKYLKLLPIGVGGELCISGAGLARGYLNRPELTAEKFCLRRPGALFKKTAPGPRKNFLFEPYSPTHLLTHSPFYKTGDLAQRLPDGNIAFLGRIDHQVKIRGFRIELGEIENQLLKHNDVKEVVVIVKNDQTGNKFLCAYIVPAVEGAPLSAEKLRTYLSQSLPDYMLPSYFMSLDAIPLTLNGKLDRQALPEPEAVSRAHYEPPQNEIEKALVESWQSVFGIETVGINDNFFEIGGDSIKVIQIAARLRHYGLKLQVKDIFANPTIKNLGKYVKQVDRDVDQGIVEGNVPLTPVQQWFFENGVTGKHHFNLAVMLCHKDGKIDESILEKVLAKLTEHHDALRMVYVIQGDRILQKNRGLEGKLFDLEIIRLEGNIETEIEQEANRIQQGIDLQEGPLLKAGLFKTPGGDHLLLAIHHLVVDGISWRILLEDLSTGYQQAQKGEEITFPAKTDSFQYWSQKLLKYTRSKEVLKELEYWKEVLSGRMEQLPTDYPIEPGKKKIKNNETSRLQLTGTETRQLLTQVHRVYNTEINDILLTALAVAINQWAGLEKIWLNLEGHGRESLIETFDVNRTVGWFTSHFPVVLDVKKAHPLSYKIKKVKETLRRIPHRGVGYSVLKYLVPAEKKQGFTFNTEPEINFNYLGQFQEIENNDAIFAISPKKMGETMNPELQEVYTLDINGMLVEGKLTLSVTYNKYQYESNTIEKLMDCLRTTLLDFIQHCINKDQKELTPSDVGDEELSIEELNEIEEMIQM